MLIQYKYDSFVNTRNISYIRLDENYFEFTMGFNKHIDNGDYKYTAKEELKKIIEEDLRFLKFIDESDVYINVEYIDFVKLERFEQDDCDTCLVYFVNDENSFSIKCKEDIENPLETINKRMKEVYAAKYVSSFSEE